MGRRFIPESKVLLNVGLIVLVPLVVLAVLLSTSLTGAVRHQALEDAERRAAVVAELVGDKVLARTARGAPSGAVRRALAPLVRDGGAVAVTIVGRDGRVAYSTRRGASRSGMGPAVAAGALGGTPGAVLAGSGVSETIEAAVPLGADEARPAGALAIELSYAPVRAELAGDVRRLQLILLIGLVALCAGLVRTTTSAASRMRDQAEENERRALRDTLTGLPNRALLNRLLEEALTARGREGSVAVLVMDLDRFKEINDTLGHFNGDVVIERVGERLRTVVRDGDTVARLGGDEFAMLLTDVPSAEAVAATATRIHRALDEPFTAGGLALRVEASIGIALHPQDGERAGALLRAADVAMYAAKQAHTGHAFYRPDQQQYSPARLGLVAQLERAMDKHELVLHYQPQARLSTGAVEGVEALVRWNHPQRGLLMPDEFVGVTEHTSMIRPLTIHVIETALDQLRIWERDGIGLNVAVNLSAQVLLDLGLPDEIGRMLKRVGAPAHRLELEVTESAIMYDPRRTKRVLDALHEMGLRIAIDDFGTGYSSLVSLKNLPVSTIKIDKSFVMGMESDADDAAIVKSTTQLGRNLGLEVVAEGVETPAAWNELARLGCDHAQGYHLSRPLAPEQFSRWLGAYRALFAGPLGVPAVANGHPSGTRPTAPRR